MIEAIMFAFAFFMLIGIVDYFARKLVRNAFYIPHLIAWSLFKAPKIAVKLLSWVSELIADLYNILCLELILPIYYGVE